MADKMQVEFLERVALLNFDYDYGHGDESDTDSKRWNQWREKNPSVKIDLSGARLPLVRLCNVNLSDANLQDTSLWGRFWRANLTNANLTNADLTFAELEGADLRGADLRGANLKGTRISDETKIDDKWLLVHSLVNKGGIDRDLRDADLCNANLSRANLKNANLGNANLSYANLSRANLRNANLGNANLSYANLIEADFRGTNLRCTEISDETKIDDKWLLVHSLVNKGGVKRDLSGTNLSGANLSDINLSGANLSGTNLSGANLSGANLESSLLSESSLLHTIMDRCMLSGACVQDWNFNYATSWFDVQCQYIYQCKEVSNGELKFTDRVPKDPNTIFQPGEFEALVRKQQDTIDLIFVEGIDWQAFFQSFQDLRTHYQNDEIVIQAIERKGKGAFIVRLATSASSEAKKVIEASAKELYEIKLRYLNDQVEFYKVELANKREALLRADAQLENIVEKLAIMSENQQRPNVSVNIRDSNVVGFSTGDGAVAVSQVTQAIATNHSDIIKLLDNLKACVQYLPHEKQNSIDLHLTMVRTELGSN